MGSILSYLTDTINAKQPTYFGKIKEIKDDPVIKRVLVNNSVNKAFNDPKLDVANQQYLNNKLTFVKTVELKRDGDRCRWVMPSCDAISNLRIRYKFIHSINTIRILYNSIVMDELEDMGDEILDALSKIYGVNNKIYNTDSLDCTILPDLKIVKCVMVELEDMDDDVLVALKKIHGVNTKIYNICNIDYLDYIILPFDFCGDGRYMPILNCRYEIDDSYEIHITFKNNTVPDNFSIICDTYKLEDTKITEYVYYPVQKIYVFQHKEDESKVSCTSVRTNGIATHLIIITKNIIKGVKIRLGAVGGVKKEIEIDPLTIEKHCCRYIIPFVPHLDLENIREYGINLNCMGTDMGINMDIDIEFDPDNMVICAKATDIYCVSSNLFSLKTDGPVFLC